MKIFTYILLLIIILIGLTFASLNAEPVTVNYYFAKSSLPLALLLVFTLSIGCLLGFFAGGMMYLRQKRENHRLRSRAKLVEKEVENLRAIPLKNEH